MQAQGLRSNNDCVQAYAKVRFLAIKAFPQGPPPSCLFSCCSPARLRTSWGPLYHLSLQHTGNYQRSLKLVATIAQHSAQHQCFLKQIATVAYSKSSYSARSSCNTSTAHSRRDAGESKLVCHAVCAYIHAKTAVNTVTRCCCYGHCTAFNVRAQSRSEHQWLWVAECPP